MPCSHKFLNDLNLDYVNYQPTTLIVGTFNPSWPDNNYASWFYGRTGNNYFWDVLPRLYQPESLRQEDAVAWKAFCQNNSIAITDLMASINDADINNPGHLEVMGAYEDSAIANSFNEFGFTDIIGLLGRFPSIKNVYLTRLNGLPLIDQQWQLIEQYCEAHNIYCARLRTPSKNARFQMGNYRQLHPEDPTPLRNFILEEWQNQWHPV